MLIFLGFVLVVEGVGGVGEGFGGMVLVVFVVFVSLCVMDYVVMFLENVI